MSNIGCPIYPAGVLGIQLLEIIVDNLRYSPDFSKCQFGSLFNLIKICRLSLNNFLYCFGLTFSSGFKIGSICKPKPRDQVIFTQLLYNSIMHKQNIQVALITTLHIILILCSLQSDIIFMWLEKTIFIEFIHFSPMDITPVYNVDTKLITRRK